MELLHKRFVQTYIAIYIYIYLKKQLYISAANISQVIRKAD